jgi:hypothetical protein
VLTRELGGNVVKQGPQIRVEFRLLASGFAG